MARRWRADVRCRTPLGVRPLAARESDRSGRSPAPRSLGAEPESPVLTDLDRYAFELLLVSYFAEREGLALPAPLARTVTPGRLSPRVAAAQHAAGRGSAGIRRRAERADVRR